MTLCEVDNPALIRGQVEAFLRTKTPDERQNFALFFGSFMQRQLRSIVDKGNRRYVHSGSWLRKTVGGELFIQRQVITDQKTGLPIIDPDTQLPIGHITSLTHRWTDDDNLSLSIIQEKRGSIFNPIVLLTQIQATSPDQTITLNPTLDRS